MTQSREIARGVNPDPLSGAHGSHPVGTGIGATGGAVAFAAMGAIASGPVGAVIGAAIGAVAGGAAGRSLGEAINPTQREIFVERNYRSRDDSAHDQRHSD
jgi:phage tail tape-measure protein